MSISIIDNRQLFSEVYLREWRAAKTNVDVCEAARQTVGDWRQEYVDLSDSGNIAAFVRQTLSALDVAYSPISEGFTLFSDAAKECATGLCLLVQDDDLSRAVKGRHHQERIVRQLRAANLKWGILTNGLQWRLCCAGSSAPYELYLDAHLDAMLQNPIQEDFSTFHHFFGGAAWRIGESDIPDSLSIGLDSWIGESEKRTQAIERHLKSRVEEVLAKLCLGFVAHDSDSHEYSREELDEVYRNSIYLLYRILFLFYAEARGLLPIENSHYQPVSLQSLVELARRRESDGERSADGLSLWKRLTSLFVMVDDGSEEMGVNAYNGGLFSDVEKPYLKNHLIGDEYLSPAIFDLAFEITKSGAHLIDYRDLSVRHLGTLYEGLLEFKLNIVKADPIVLRESKGKRLYVPQSEAGTIKKSETILERGQVYFADDKGERKASGSYYTPEDVVQYIVSNTVKPKLDEIRQSLDEQLKDVHRELQLAATPQEREQAQRWADGQVLAVVENQILNLKVLDPAMGSGHFLVAAGQMISDAIVETLNITDWPNDEISTDPLVWKRRVVERCLYGVDKNPLAHELAKLALWIASASRGKPLTFLDHHLKVGNSLLGAPLSRLSKLPVVQSKGKKKSKISDADAPVVRDLFAPTRDAVIEDLLKQMREINTHDSDHIADVKWKEKAARSAEVRGERLRAVADMWLATLFGLQSNNAPMESAEWMRHLDEVAVNFSPEQWQTRVAGSKVLLEAQEIAKREAFFHWELEFPDTVQNEQCCFDCIVANPPYVGTKADAAINELYQTAPCGDLYAWLFERALKVLSVDGNLGTIVPLSLMFSRNFTTLREVILGLKVHARFANFDATRDGIFPPTGNARNGQRATIALLSNGESKLQIDTTNLMRWIGEERPQLIPSLTYADVTKFAEADVFPKLGNSRLSDFWNRAITNHKTISEVIYREKENSETQSFYNLYVSGSCRYFITAMPTAMRSTGLIQLSFYDEWIRDITFLVLNSNIYYWLWYVLGDGFHITTENINAMIFPIIPEDNTKVRLLRDKLLNAAEECATYQTKWGEKIPNYNFNKRMDILLEIDDWIVSHVAPELNLPRDIFAQYKSNSFLRPLDLSSFGDDSETGDEE